EKLTNGLRNFRFSGVVRQPIKYKSNNKPIINGADNINLTEGTEFNPMAGVSATDIEDGNITKNIKIIGFVDVNTPGSYEILYSVTDSNKNTSFVKRIVNVIPVENTAPVIKGTGDLIINKGEAFDPRKGVSAIDKEDGNITKDIEINGTVNINTPGRYILIYKVSDKKGFTTTSIRVIDVVE
ncbi:immunoglobulin-like domain-containing protein, partial [Clostridium perfringens]|uniref:immunoglobulin-like domain-containing protein n=1 Tax=Clostridium perfringens TaxID=1502 RepID=UPI0039E82991